MLYFTKVPYQDNRFRVQEMFWYAESSEVGGVTERWQSSRIFRKFTALEECKSSHCKNKILMEKSLKI